MKFNEHYRGPRRSSSEGARAQSAHLARAEAVTQAGILQASNAWHGEKVAGIGSGLYGFGLGALLTTFGIAGVVAGVQQGDVGTIRDAGILAGVGVLGMGLGVYQMFRRDDDEPPHHSTDWHGGDGPAEGS